MPPKDAKGGKSKQIQAAKSAAKGGSGGGKAKKKKWSKAKSEKKTTNMVLFDKPTYEALYKRIPSSKLITVSSTSEALKISGSLALKALRELASKGLIKPVHLHSNQVIYTRATSA
ncbi:hypothetical protein PROFUN_12927 [Planoprotostelium fungivorum]|uniref:40S ribosomal protein S25 n=1 Tax=Planoprotostelium fungivorum TaxID=1890364 RepID=A0A2P6N612_9EUKA|nr:hypothetical protein PROFUN_12927 [Planoprotostelium fungivorum]